MSNHYTDGELARMATTSPFTNTETGDAVDPTVVKVEWSYIGDTVTTTWVYGTDAQVVRDGTGEYHADNDTTGRGGETCTYCVIGDPDGTVDPVCQAIDCNTFVVDPRPL
jgi:hypothetical protein